MIDGLRPICRKTFRRRQLGFNGHTLRGATEQRPRWKRGIGTVNDSIGKALGQHYVKKYFTPAKARRRSSSTTCSKASEAPRQTRPG